MGQALEARDFDIEVSAVGETCDEALNQLEDVVAAVRGEGGHSPSDEELCAVGVVLRLIASALAYWNRLMNFGGAVRGSGAGVAHWAPASMLGNSIR